MTDFDDWFDREVETGIRYSGNVFGSLGLSSDRMEDYLRGVIRSAFEAGRKDTIPRAEADATMSDLKPCPFCGGPADAGYFPGDYDIGCNTCLISVSRHASDFDGDIEAAKAEAVAAWNTRPDQIPRAEAEAMVAEAVAKERKRIRPYVEHLISVARRNTDDIKEWNDAIDNVEAAIRQTEGEG